MSDLSKTTGLSLADFLAASGVALVIVGIVLGVISVPSRFTGGVNSAACCFFIGAPMAVIGACVGIWKAAHD